jgi:predicted nucleic acid-binding protein
MYLLDADDDRIPPLRAALAPLGDSLVVVGGDRLWNVHVHDDDVGAAIEAGIGAGRPHRVRVTHLAEQVTRARQRTATRTGRRIVAYGDIRAFLDRQGTPIGANDLLIAATALADQLILVTHNTREFERVPDLSLEDWEIEDAS